MIEQFTAERGKTGLMKLKSNKLRGAVATLHYGHIHTALLSTSPKLLDVLKGVMEWASNSNMPFELSSKARMAIAKDEGRLEL